MNDNGADEFDRTDGGVRVQRGTPGTGTTIISDPPESTDMEMSVVILDDDLAWLIETLTALQRQIVADANRAQDAAALVQWDADVLASMMTG